jgi:hypothetical protein
MAERQPPTSLLGMGLQWTRVGYGVGVVILVAFILLIVVSPVKSYAGNPPNLTGYKVFPGKEGGVLLKASGLAAFTVFLYVFGALAAFVWTFVDLIDRQKRFVWLLPMFVCPLMGLHVLPFAVYLFFGRETPVAESGVK